MKKTYNKNLQVTERTNMGYSTLADELQMDQWNEKLAQVQGLGFDTPAFSPSGSGPAKQITSPLRMEDINESVAAITSGMQGMFKGYEGEKLSEAQDKNSIEALAGLTEDSEPSAADKKEGQRLFTFDKTVIGAAKKARLLMTTGNGLGKSIKDIVKKMDLTPAQEAGVVWTFAVQKPNADKWFSTYYKKPFALESKNLKESAETEEPKADETPNEEPKAETQAPEAKTESAAPEAEPAAPAAPVVSDEEKAKAKEAYKAALIAKKAKEKAIEEYKAKIRK